MLTAEPLQHTLVSRERVVAPPDRFIDVTDGELLTYFQSCFPASDKASLSKLQEMLEGLCTNSFSRLRRQLEQDFTFFANAANETPGTDPRERNPAAVADQLDAQEARFLENFLKLLEAGHYKLLTAAEWDAACAEEFLLTLPVSVNYDAMDDTLLPRALWAAHPDAREGAPPEIVDRMLVFHRGVDVAHINGTFLMPKVDLLISFYILQPMFALFTWIMAKLGVKRFVPEAPTYVAPAEEADAAVTDATTKAEVKATAAAIKAGQLHEATVSIERRTFARAFPNGKSVFQQLLKKVDLREACFKDVIVLYRKSVPNGKVQRQEMDLIKDADPEFVKRNLVVKRFASIPISDLELVFPDKKIYLPPQMMVNLVVTIVGALVTVITTLSAGVSLKVVWPVVTMLATRASQSYATAQAQRTAIERAMQKLLYDRTMASQAAVITSLTEEMARQQTRELLVCYCVLASAMSCVTPDELDTRCEAMLANQFGLKVDFTCEEALPTLLEWGLAVRDPAAVGGAVSAVPVAEALAKVDAKWDSLYDFSGPAATSILSKKPGKVFGNVLAAAKGGMSKKERSDAAPAPEGEVMHGKAAVPPAAASSTVAASSVEGKKKKSFFSRLRS